tara:strand:+ start:481 stop:1344 length:864 start_codon:yes stop_codon:yes gene_type:complete
MNSLPQYICYNWFGLIADHCLDYSEDFYRSIDVTKLHDKTLDVNKVKEGDVIFVKTDYIYKGFFQHEVLPLITVPFSLITGGSSYQVGLGSSIDGILNHPLLLKWFCTNAPPVNSSKLIPLPIGLQERERPGGNQDLIHSLYRSKTSFDKKSPKVLLPYHGATNPVRGDLFSHLRALPFVEAQEKKLPWEEYIRLLDKYKFVISLPGSGPDVHRNYETLLMNSIPLQEKNIMESLFLRHSLPGVFLDRWGDLTPDFFTQLQESDFVFEKSNLFLTISYHINYMNGAF